MHPIYRTDVPLLPRVHFLYCQSINIFNYFLDFLSPSSFIPPQNVAYLLMLHFLVHKTFTFYINGVLNCKNVQLQGQRVKQSVFRIHRQNESRLSDKDFVKLRGLLVSRDRGRRIKTKALCFFLSLCRKQKRNLQRKK